jgi:hypothetical protein
MKWACLYLMQWLVGLLRTVYVCIHDFCETNCVTSLPYETDASQDHHPSIRMCQNASTQERASACFFFLVQCNGVWHCTTWRKCDGGSFPPRHCGSGDHVGPVVAHGDIATHISVCAIAIGASFAMRWHRMTPVWQSTTVPNLLQRCGWTWLDVAFLISSFM